jgi:hypothetical protein
MSNVALLGPITGVRRLLSGVSSGVRGFLLGIAEGVAAARRYERLVAMSEGELERLGLSREEVPWAAMFGDRRRG